MGDPAVRVRDVSKVYTIGARRHDTLRDWLAANVRGVDRRRENAMSANRMWALRDVSLEIEPGEIVGIVGRNGAGKSTLLKILSRITAPTTGRVEIRGALGSLLEVGTGFHPELTGRENVYLNGAILGMARDEIKRKFDDIVEFAEVGQFIDTPIKRYSSGMYVRLAFSVAAHLEPEVLLIDEVLSVGDQEFQQRCLGRVQEISREGRTIVFVSHNLAAVSSLCTRAYLLEGGRSVAEGDVDDVLVRYVSSMHRLATSSLVDRVDREGTGAMRFASVSVSGPDGAVQVGRPATFTFEWVSEASRRGVEISFAVFGPLGEALFHCQSRAGGTSLDIEPGGGRLRCKLPELPLLPGVYSLNVFASVGGDQSAVAGEVLDWVRDALEFEVFENDFLGHGHLPRATHGHIVVRQEWDSAVSQPTGDAPGASVQGL